MADAPDPLLTRAGWELAAPMAASTTATAGALFGLPGLIAAAGAAAATAAVSAARNRPPRPKRPTAKAAARRTPARPATGGGRPGMMSRIPGLGGVVPRLGSGGGARPAGSGSGLRAGGLRGLAAGMGKRRAPGAATPSRSGASGSAAPRPKKGAGLPAALRLGRKGRPAAKPAATGSGRSNGAGSAGRAGSGGGTRGGSAKKGLLSRLGLGKRGSGAGRGGSSGSGAGGGRGAGPSSTPRKRTGAGTPRGRGLLSRLRRTPGGRSAPGGRGAGGPSGGSSTPGKGSTGTTSRRGRMLAGLRRLARRQPKKVNLRKKRRIMPRWLRRTTRQKQPVATTPASTSTVAKGAINHALGGTRTGRRAAAPGAPTNPTAGPAPAPITTGGPMPANPFAAVVEAAAVAAQSYDPDNALRVMEWFDAMPELIDAIAGMLTAQGVKTTEEFFLYPAAAEFAAALGAQFRRYKDPCEAAKNAFERAHADDIERVKNPQRHQDKWDISRNRS